MVRLIAIYTRLSPNPVKDEAEGQEEVLVSFAAKQGWTVVEVYKDILVSGGKRGSDRPAFKRMNEDARKRRFDLILFYSLDRLSREGVVETFSYLKTWGDWGIDYKSYTEQFLDSCGPFRDAVIGLLACIARQERLRISERTRVGLDNARRKGVKLGRKPAKIDKVIALRMREEGEPLIRIAARFSVSEATMSRYLKKLDTAEDEDIEMEVA